MKLCRIALLILLLLALVLPSAAVADEDWKEIIRDSVARIDVEKALYERPNSSGVFIHVRITNLATRKLGLDLSNRRNVVYLNQVGYSQEDHRLVIDELRTMGWNLTANEQDALRQAFAAQKLQYFEPGESIDYFIDFDDGGRFDPHVVKDKYLLLIVDGAVFATDGQQVYTISLEKPSADREVPLPTPLQWKTIPEKAVVFEFIWKRKN